MTTDDHLTRLIAGLPRSPLSDSAVLDEAGRALGIQRPNDYIAVMRDHDGVEGDIGDWNLVLRRAADLVEANTDPVMEFFPDLVIVGGDGGGEALAIHRGTHEVLLVPWIGSEDDWLVLGRTFTEALQRMQDGSVFDAPKWRATT
jgi:hypothetical protein